MKYVSNVLYYVRAQSAMRPKRQTDFFSSILMFKFLMPKKHKIKHNYYYYLSDN